jgi:hypothetical protein
LRHGGIVRRLRESRFLLGMDRRFHRRAHGKMNTGNEGESGPAG